MPRLSQAVPRYQKHRATGQAVVRVNGRDYYLGPHGTKASRLEYDRLIGEWLATGRSISYGEREAEKQEGDNRTMGRKFTVPYGLYREHGFINPHLAVQTGFNENGQDLDLFWAALANMFETDRSAARGEMAPRALVVFEHESPLGNAPAHQLFDRVRVERPAASNGEWKPARAFEDYNVAIDENNLPNGIKVHRMI